MSRRAELPGAAELFRPTGRPEAGQESDQLTVDSRSTTGHAGRSESSAAGDARMVADSASAPSSAGRINGNGNGNAVSGNRQDAGVRRSSGRQRHDEKITVYISADELHELETTRLSLRREHGVAVDRGRIVREAMAMALADLEERGAESELVRRLRGES